MDESGDVADASILDPLQRLFSAHIGVGRPQPLTERAVAGHGEAIHGDIAKGLEKFLQRLGVGCFRESPFLAANPGPQFGQCDAEKIFNGVCRELSPFRTEVGVEQSQASAGGRRPPPLETAQPRSQGVVERGPFRQGRMEVGGTG